MNEELNFGDYAVVEQQRFGVPNELYLHKVIRTLRSNTWVDVPVQIPRKEVLHDKIEDVVSLICCGIKENEVLKHRVSDVRKHVATTELNPT